MTNLITLETVRKSITLRMIEFGVPLTNDAFVLFVEADRELWTRVDHPDQSLMLSILDQLLIEHTESDPYSTQS